MSEAEPRVKRIAALNDEFRRHAGLAMSRRVPGRSVMTRGVAALADETKVEIFQRVREFSEFKTGNDPYSEHDFGAITAAGEEVFWKIDYYENESMEYGADDPADPARSFRVLTVMLAAEY